MIKVKLDELKKSVGTLRKGWLESKLIAQSRFLSFKVSDNKLDLLNSDIDNILLVSIPIENPNNDTYQKFIEGNLFNEYITKVQGDYITFELKENGIEARIKDNMANFEYLSDVDAEEFIKDVPKPVGQSVEVDAKHFLDSLRILKAGNNTVDTINVLSNIYIGNEALSSNGYRISSIKKSLIDFSNTDYKEFLFPIHLIELLNVFSEKDKFTFYGADENKYLYFISDNITVAGIDNDNFSKFPKGKMLKIINETVSATYSVDRLELFNMVDRIRLFIKESDRGAVKVELVGKTLTLKPLHSKAVENIVLTEIGENFEDYDFTSLFDIKNFLVILENLTSKTVHIQFFDEQYIGLSDENFYYIASIMWE